VRIFLTCIFVLALLAPIAGCSGPASVVSQPSTPISVITMQPTAQTKFSLPPVTPNPTCVPPCFYNIVPGKTTITDAFRFLGATSLQTGDQNDGALIWTTQRPPREWNAEVASVENSISFRQGVVSSIRIRPQQDITLQSVVSKYGDPETVAVGSPGGPSALFETVLLYPAKGLAFFGRWRPQSDTRSEVYTPHPETLVDSEIYFSPVSPTDLSVDDVNRWRASYVTDIFPWPGFGNLMEPH
jgi:hypothetical protein